MPNHFHLLLKTGATPIAWVMKRLLTGYAVHYNRRHRRSGHLFQQLDRYRYSGHSALMGLRPNEWQAMDSMLRPFGESLPTARGRYRHFVEQGIALGRRPELTGGGLIRSLGGWRAVKSMRR